MSIQIEKIKYILRSVNELHDLVDFLKDRAL